MLCYVYYYSAVILFTYHHGVVGSWASLLVNDIIYNDIIIITILEFVHRLGVTGGQSPLLIRRLLIIGVSYHGGKGLVVFIVHPSNGGGVTRLT